MKTEAIWSNFGNKLLGFIKARVSNTENAEDILQDVFVKIHQKSEQLKDETKLASWIYQITRNAIIDFYRKKKIPLSEIEAVEMNEEIEVKSNPQFIKCLMPFIDELPAKYKDALIKTVYGEMSQKEYAKEINLSYSGVKSRVQRARQMVKESFVNCCSIKTDNYGNVISSTIDDCSC